MSEQWAGLSTASAEYVSHFMSISAGPRMNQCEGYLPCELDVYYLDQKFYCMVFLSLLQLMAYFWGFYCIFIGSYLNVVSLLRS